MPGNGFRIGTAIRDLRRTRNLTGEDLGKQAGLSQSRISKIETGSIINIKPVELKKILDVLNAPQTIRQQALAILDSPERSRLRHFRSNYSSPAFGEFLEELRRTTSLHVFCLNLVPSLLQTAAYREALINRQQLARGERSRQMQTVFKAQDLIWDKHKRFRFILHESVLYNTTGDHATQFAQLDRLDRLVDARNIKLGIIALEAGTVPKDVTSFVVHDERWLAIAMAGANITSHESDEIAEYLKLFAAIDRKTDYGGSARALIRKAMDYFS